MVSADKQNRSGWRTLSLWASALCVTLMPLTSSAQAPPLNAPPRPAPQPVASEYEVGPKDVLAITVRNQANLSGRFTIESDGRVNFPLIGRVPAAGLTVRGVESEISKRLADGFFTNPEVSVTIEEYRSQRVVVTGEVQVPGPVPLTGPTTLIEVLALARTTPAASKEALIVRPAPGRSLPVPASATDVADSEVIRVDLNALETGNLSNNIVLRDGDTIFIPKAATVVVFGQVRSPGVYPVQKDTTLYHVLALAGGVTDRGSLSRIKVMRMVNGKQKDISLKLSDVVRAGDTIVARERLY